MWASCGHCVVCVAIVCCCGHCVLHMVAAWSLCSVYGRCALCVVATVYGHSHLSVAVFRAQDLKAKKHHIPLVDRSPLEPPPVVVVVVGPPRVGKSTLIRCLIKNFTRQKLSDICGPITIISGERDGTSSCVTRAGVHVTEAL